MKKIIRYEISVGLFVIVAAVLLGYISLTISRMRVRDGIEVGFVFPDACGLVKNAPVSVAGVEIGYITGLDLDAGRALVTTRISKKAGLRRGVRATVRSKSLLGEKFLELTPSGRDAPLLADGDLVTATESPVQIDRIFAWLGRTLDAVDPDQAAKLITAIAQDPDAARRIVKNTDALLKKLSDLDENKVKEFTDQLSIRARLF